MVDLHSILELNKHNINGDAETRQTISSGRSIPSDELLHKWRKDTTENFPQSSFAHCHQNEVDHKACHEELTKIL